MIIGRFIAWLFLAVTGAVLVRDAVMWLDTGTLAFITLGELWFIIHSGSLNLVQAVTQRYILPELWDPVIVTLLLWPAAAIFGTIGLLLLWGFHRRR